MHTQRTTAGAMCHHRADDGVDLIRGDCCANGRRAVTVDTDGSERKEKKRERLVDKDISVHARRGRRKKEKHCR